MAPAKPERLCFLVGAPRSGTTWVQRLLHAHPGIGGGEESQFFTLFAHPLRAADQLLQDTRPTGPLIWMERPAFETAIRDIWDRMFEAHYASTPDMIAHVEKTPFHALCLDEVVRLFPEARIVFLTRDARAVASSLVHAGRGWGAAWAPRSVREAASVWHRHVRAVALWRASHPDQPFFQVRYEDLLRDTEAELERLLRFVLPDDAKIDARGALDRFRSSQDRPGDPAGFARKRGANGWQQDMTIYNKLITYRYTRRLMRELGYEPTIFGERSTGVLSGPGS